MKEDYIVEAMPEERFKKGLGLLSMLLLLLVASTAVNPDLLAAQADSSKESSSGNSRTAASLIALSGTAFPVILGLSAEPPANLIILSSGLVFGPVLGYAYMGDAKLGIRYAGTRALIIGGTIGSVSLICALGDCNIGLFGEESGSEFDLAVTIFLAGSAATIIHNLKDTFTIGKQIERRGSRMTVTPAYFQDQQAPGIRVMRRF